MTITTLFSHTLRRFAPAQECFREKCKRFSRKAARLESRASKDIGSVFDAIKVGRTLLTLSALPLLAACATGSPPPELTKSGYSCVDDSVECVSRRQALLRQLTADNSRSWLKEHPTPEAYASGVRLFAMKTKKREMNCDELDRGRREADGAQTSLRSAGGKLTPAQVSRGAMFATEVSRELTNEMGRRCKKA